MVNCQPSGPTSFSELLQPLPADVREVATRLRAIVQAAVPDADEAVSGGARMGMALCRLFFHGWKQLEESGYRLEGSGKNARHIKIRSSEELDPDAVADMIRSAAKHVEG